ncbi:hypothetical protein B0T17DRAFT_655008 [Bombardia bombarda]|uniref:DNA (cytosine-5-)-methyltransferase n=1 Tax=Bombardia bombarda TaxID=252184 RepID=A0AA39X0X7_9PEZI|nr:hypothetical protein B0T17DRAFT_655008 [Bombardia bombarda]
MSSLEEGHPESLRDDAEDLEAEISNLLDSERCSPTRESYWETPGLGLEREGEEGAGGLDDDEVAISEASSVKFDDRRSTHIYVDLPRSTLTTPKSQHHGYIPPLPPTRERIAVRALLEAAEAQGNVTNGFIGFELDRFSFYVNSKIYPYEMRPLHHLATKNAHDKFYVDGILSVGDVKHYVSGVEVSELPIGNYGIEHPGVDGQIWARSSMNSREEIYYRLNNPALEYVRFYDPFRWIADLAKHFVDFCSDMIDHQQEVELSSFKKCFIQWLVKAHGNAESFVKWRREHPSDDFRTSVVANLEFIWKETNGVLESEQVASLKIFREIRSFNQYKPDPAPKVKLVVQDNETARPTIVTPYIKECFGHMVIGKMLQLAGNSSSPAEPLLSAERPRGRSVEQPKINSHLLAQAVESRHGKPVRYSSTKSSFLSKAAIDHIAVGDTISTPPDGEDVTDTKWKIIKSRNSTEDNRWFGLVQKVHVANDGSRSFDVSWFYRPAETPCCVMKYPWSNELFLSDHCTCGEGKASRVKGHEVLGVHTIDWWGKPNTDKGDFFVRQTYVIEQRRWMTLDKSHIKCDHSKRPPLGFATGDTVLVSTLSDEFTDVYEVVKIFRQETNRFVRLRKLVPRRKIDPLAPNAPPNELVYTEDTVVVKPEKITRKCLVRFFPSDKPVLDPYNRGGTGNLFYITSRLSPPDFGPRCVPFADGDFPSSLHQGFDPSQEVPKLKGLDLFCGGGNFGRGLEDGGVVDMCWVNDIWEKAVHTYMANTPNQNKTHPYLGSVDDLLLHALEGRFSDNVPRPGDVDFISAGSPCPGFSLLTRDKTTLSQIKNQSLVASFASFVDFYRPKFGVLENVTSIVQARHNRKEDVLSQLFCALVGLGYQAQLVMGDAWSHGAPQSRSRVFLYFAAQGQRLPEAPPLSHSHYSGVKKRGLGEMCNSQPFVHRLFSPTPFKFVSAAESAADLPFIGDGKPDCCVPFPDHRLPSGITKAGASQYAAIPTHPHGMKFTSAWKEGNGIMTEGDRELFPAAPSARTSAISQGWARVKPHNIYPTVTTRCQPTDARSGPGLHWHENRPLSVIEMRRAQGYLDHEVLLGIPPDQFKLIGNSVARQIALALGLKFREAWLGTLYDDGGRYSIPVSASNGVKGEERMASDSTTARRRRSSRGLMSRSTTISATPSRTQSPMTSVEPEAADTTTTARSESTPMTVLSGVMETGSRTKRKSHSLLAEELQPSKVRKLREGQGDSSSSMLHVARESVSISGSPTPDPPSEHRSAFNLDRVEVVTERIQRAPFPSFQEESRGSTPSSGRKGSSTPSGPTVVHL